MKNGYNLVAGLVALLAVPSVAFAEGAASTGLSYTSLSAAVAIGLGVLGGAFGQAKAVSAIAEAIGRNPSAAGKLNVPLFVGLALIESLVILAFVIALNLANKA